MNALKSWRFVAIANLALGLGAVLAVACSGDDSSGEGPPGTDASTKQDTSLPDAQIDVASPDSASPEAGSPPGCFAGTPVNSLDFENACTTADYVVFDNCARIGYCDGGTLPALVTPPVDAGAPDAADAAADAADAAADADDSG